MNKLQQLKGGNMIRVQTFTNELKAMHAMKELNALDVQVNQFIKENNVQKVLSVSDTCTTGDGDTIGIIRVLAFETT
jgi:hypothetical protein